MSADSSRREVAEAADGPVGTGTVPDEFALTVDAAAADYLSVAPTNGGTAFYIAISDPDQGDHITAYGDAGVAGS